MDRRRNAVYLIIAASLLSGLITGRSFFYNIAYAFIGLLGFSFFWAWSSANWLRLGRRTRTRRAYVGGELKETFFVSNTGFLPKLWLEIYDGSTLPGHRASHVISGLASNDQASWDVKTVCSQRGEYTLGPLRIVTGDPFGLFQIEREITDTTRLVVYPRTVDIMDFALPGGPLPGGSAIQRRTHFVTTNAVGIRDYVPGDSLNRIHWLSTARKGRLLVKEFELDPLTDIWLMLDGERTVHIQGEPHPDDILPPTTEEYAVTITASLAQYFLGSERALGFSTYAQYQDLIQTDRGTRQITKIFEVLATLRAEGTLPLATQIDNEGGKLLRGTTLIVVTPSVRDGWVTEVHELTLRGIQVVPVIIDPESFGGRPGLNRVTRRLEDIGVRSHIIRRGDDITAALS